MSEVKYNYVELRGRAGADAVLKFLPNGTPVAEFRLAVGKKVGNEWRTNWFNVKLWATVASEYSAHIKRGSTVHVIGELSQRSWTGKDGQEKSTVEIIGWNIQVLPPKEKKQAQEFKMEEPRFTDDTIPF